MLGWEFEDMVDRAARAIVHLGWSSLTDSEQDVMNNDDKFFNAVLKRVNELKPNRKSKNEEEPQNDNPNIEQELVTLALFNDKIKFVSLRRDDKYTFLDDAQNQHKIFYVFTLKILALKKAVEELEYLINNPNNKEKNLQDFFERNPDFILNDDYKAAHSQIVLTKDDGKKLIPDFLLEPMDQNALCDILELKLPSIPIFVKEKNTMRFSATVVKACAQLREYSIFFDEEKNRKAIYKKYALFAFKPKMFVIIGRSGKVNPIEVRKIESDLPNLHLRTYDQLIARMKKKIDSLTK